MAHYRDRRQEVEDAVCTAVQACALETWASFCRGQGSAKAWA
jgi:hypothetical protein